MFPFSAIVIKVVSTLLSMSLTFGVTAPAFAPSGGCADFKAHSLAATCEVSDANATATNDAHKFATATPPLYGYNPVALAVESDVSEKDESVWNDEDHDYTGAWANGCAQMWKVIRRDNHAVVGVCWQNYAGARFYGLTTDGVLVRYAGDRWLPVSSGNLFYVVTNEGIGVVKMDENGDVTIRVPDIIRGSEHGDGEYAVVLGKGCASVTECPIPVYDSTSSGYTVGGIRLTWRQSSYPYQKISIDISANEAVALGAPRTFGALAG